MGFLKWNFKLMAPDAGFEPATKRLTAAYSTAELIRNKKWYAQEDSNLWPTP